MEVEKTGELGNLGSDERDQLMECNNPTGKLRKEKER